MRQRYVIVGLLVTALALPSSFGGVAFGAGNKASHEGTQINLDQMPAAAQATIQREAKGGTLERVTQDIEKGKMVYEAEIQKNGKTRFVAVSPEGKVVKRESAKKEAKEEAREKK